MKVRIIPHGSDIQRRFEYLTQELGTPEREAQNAVHFFEVEWPENVRLPVAGDVLNVDWVDGRVKHVAFVLDDDGQWYFIIKLDR